MVSSFSVTRGRPDSDPTPRQRGFSTGVSSCNRRRASSQCPATCGMLADTASTRVRGTLSMQRRAETISLNSDRTRCSVLAINVRTPSVYA